MAVNAEINTNEGSFRGSEPISIVSVQSTKDEKKHLLVSSDSTATLPQRKKKWNLGNIIIFACLLLGYLIISAGYSMLAPFFPQEVWVHKSQC